MAGTLILELLLNGYMGNLMAHFKIGNRKNIYIHTVIHWMERKKI